MAFSFANTGGEKKTGTLFGSTTAPSGGLFGGALQQPQQSNAAGSSLFGASTAAPQTGGLFGSIQQQQQQQQQQQPQQQQQFSNSLFGSSLQPAPGLNPNQAQSLQQTREGLPQLRQSTAQPYAGASISGHRT